MTIHTHTSDLPANVTFNGDLGIDTETMGLNPWRDRLCVVQLSDGQGDAHLVQFPVGTDYAAPNLKKLLLDPTRTKIFHYARFDVMMLKRYLGLTLSPIFCTKIASKLTRTYTDRHGLKNICMEMLGQEISKQQQSSDWGQPALTEAQATYAAGDVLYLHKLRDLFTEKLAREGRLELAQKCFAFLPTRAELDLAGWMDVDIFSHE